jgi:aminoglycoside 3-N-acetyltransferase I
MGRLKIRLLKMSTKTQPLDNQTMTIKKLHPDEVSDFIRLIEIFKLVFENDNDTPPAGYLGQLLSKEDFFVFVVSIDGIIVGGLTIYVLHPYYSTNPIAYIYDVGIAPEFQGRGLGKALMAEVGRFCQANGFDEAYVEAEADDADAVHFYRKTAFSDEMNAVHFTYSFTD